jgi:hypothetical protein
MNGVPVTAMAAQPIRLRAENAQNRISALRGSQMPIRLIGIPIRRSGVTSCALFEHYQWLAPIAARCANSRPPLCAADPV